jgi:hypothetical protein
MFLDFFILLRDNGFKVSLHEHLTLLKALEKGIISASIDEFYALSKSIYVKHENKLDRFDMLFGHYFKGLEYIPEDLIFNIPNEWLRKNMLKNLSDEEKEMIKAMGGLDKLIERFKELLEEQKKRHEGGSKWIGTGGTSPFGAFGYNPEGFRVGQGYSRHRRAVKVWEDRHFQDLDEDQELNTRNIKMAMRHLREFTREGHQDELDLKATIRDTSKNAGWLKLVMRPAKKNNVKILLFFDIGGSMDDHIELCSQFFSAARYEFKHMTFYYFHNCIYESLWKNNKRRHKERFSTIDLLNQFNKDHKVIIVGDAAMSPYEIFLNGGSVEHHNEEAGIVWLNRLKDHFDNMVWINPNPQEMWHYYQSTNSIKEFMEDNMFPMTLEGIRSAIHKLLNPSN